MGLCLAQCPELLSTPRQAYLLFDPPPSPSLFFSPSPLSLALSPSPAPAPPPAVLREGGVGREEKGREEEGKKKGREEGREEERSVLDEIMAMGAGGAGGGGKGGSAHTVVSRLLHRCSLVLVALPCASDEELWGFTRRWLLPALVACGTHSRGAGEGVEGVEGVGRARARTTASRHDGPEQAEDRDRDRKRERKRDRDTVVWHQQWTALVLMWIKVSACLSIPQRFEVQTITWLIDYGISIDPSHMQVTPLRFVPSYDTLVQEPMVLFRVLPLCLLVQPPILALVLHMLESKILPASRVQMRSTLAARRKVRVRDRVRVRV